MKGLMSVTVTWIAILGQMACRPAPSVTAGPSPMRCCRLQGAWAISITLDSGGGLITARPGTEVLGMIRFSEGLRRTFDDPPATAPELSDEERRQIEQMEWGKFDLNFSSFWKGGPIAPVASTTRLGDHAEPLSSALGIALSRDTVGILLNPDYTHGGLALGGKFVSDSVIEGFWGVRGDRSGTRGHFRMARRR
jgi:hypothetical protein